MKGSAVCGYITLKVSPNELQQLFDIVRDGFYSVLDASVQPRAGTDDAGVYSWRGDAAN